VLFFTEIIHRFGVPNSIITDNGTQFTGRKFLEFATCTTYVWTRQQSLTERPMVRWNVPMA
jgi:hypothetical protein